ncbi:TPR repeat family protein [Orientia tsutsugamushi str. Gilliam]|uniref:TPR repeat family protein n=1 Tax=Orientia tsutsugamushi str. Gilliam TaxID=1359184 RepID=A0A0F3M4T4_ORITS|nr:tetratricopeptide repeat protein [Orientia tsutsugamushi]KJV50696.1 TPR repeat family protein [Orientia tsutsugamushi str. Gilliam]
MNKGVALSKLGQHQEAIKKFNLAIKYKPGFAEAYLNKGESLKQLGQREKAIKNLS